MSAVRKFTLGEIGPVRMCKRIMKDETSPYGEIPFFKIGTFGGKADVFISRERYEEYKSKYPYPKCGDVLISAAGTIGRLVVFDGRESYFQDSNIVWVENDEAKVTNACLYYALQLARWKPSQGSTILRLYNDDVRAVEFFAPESLSDQGRVASILSAIDRKIALNRKRIATLEAMAKEIYDYWFVQFDFPDAHGRPYKSSGGAMVYNPDLKREIPKGWCSDNLLRISKLIAGGTPSKDRADYWNGTIPFFGPTDCKGGIFQFKTVDAVTQDGLDHCAGTLMSENTVIITARGSIGKMVICGIPMTMNQSCFAFEEVAGRYEYLYFKVKELIQYLLLKGNGTTFKSIVTIDIENSILCFADDATIDCFTDRVRPLFACIKNATKEIESLFSLRDFLLPLLMNGQVKEE